MLAAIIVKSAVEVQMDYAKALLKFLKIWRIRIGRLL